MNRVKCEIHEIDLDDGYGKDVPGTMAICTRCEHETTSFGTSEASKKRCLALMRKECPEDEENFYVEEDD